MGPRTGQPDIDARAVRRGPRRRSTAMLAVATLVTALFSSFAIASAPLVANAAAGAPFPSGPAQVYLSQHQPTQLYTGSQSGGTINFTPIGSASTTPYNAIGFRTSDRYIYGMVNRQNTTANQLLRIGQNGGFDSLGAVAGIGQAHYNQGTFGSGATADILYIRDSGTDRNLFAINIAAPANGTYSASTITMSTNVPNLSDIVWKDGFIWGVWAPSGTAPSIYRISPGSGTVDNFSLGNLIPRGVSYGSQWRYGNDNLGLLSNTNGNVYQLSITDPASASPTFDLVATLRGLAASNNNDGTDYPGDPVDLGIVKATDGGFTPGESFQYTLTVTNHSTVSDSSGLVIRDPLPDDITSATTATPGCSVEDRVLVCVLGALAHGASTTVAITATAAADSAACITNTATVIGNEEDDNPANDTSSATACRGPAFTVSKTSSPAVAHPGDTVTYTVAVQNVGSTPFTDASPATFTDDLSGVVDDAGFITPAPAGAAWDPATSTLAWSGALPVGGSTTVTYSVTVFDPPPPGADGHLVNAVTAGPDGTCSSTGDCATSTPVTSFTVMKNASPSPAVVGGSVVFAFTVTNTGHASIDASFTDDVSQIEQFAIVDPDSLTGGLILQGSTISWSGTLEPGDSVTPTFTATTIDADAVANGLTNTVVTPPGSGGNCAANSDDPDCTVDVPVTDAPLTAFTVSKTASTPRSDGTAVPGDTVTYMVSVTNTGNVAFDGTDGSASFSDDLSGVIADASNVTVTAPLLFDGEHTVSWTGALEVGQTLHFTYTVSVLNPVPAAATGHLVNVVSAGDDGTCANAAACSTDVPVLVFSVAKTASADVVGLGQSVTYTVTVTNTGAGDFTAELPATFSDDLTGVLDDATLDEVPAGAEFDASTNVLTWMGAVAAHQSVTVSYTVTVNSPASGDGTMTNAVTTPPEANCATGAETGCAVTVLIPGFTVSKVASQSTAHPGDTVTYTLSVTALRASFTSATAVVTDDVTGVLDDATYNGDASPTPRTFEDGMLTWALQPTLGAPIVITYSVTVDDQPQGDNLLANVVVADPHSGGSCAPDASCSSSVPVAHFVVAKGVDADTVEPGGVVTYTISITNFGDVPFTAERPASVSDDLSRILTNATFNDDATGGAVFDGATGIISWTGTLDPGETVFVTFSITIGDNAEAVTLNNVAVTPSGSGGNCPESTDDTECAANTVVVITPPTPPTPTPTPTPEPTAPPLAGTGSNVWPISSLALVGVAVGAIALVVTARRRRRG
jgi:uncharacterized repeat protein (TIGR01451 family)